MMAVFLVVVLVTGLMLLRIVLGIALFAHGLTPRENLGRRVLVVLGLALAPIALLAQLVPTLPSPGLALVYATEMVVFALLLVAITAILMFLFDVKVWTALFCCSAGYAVQNLASGTGEAAWLLMMGTGVRAAAGRSDPFGTFSLVTWLVTGAVYALTYLTVTRKIGRRGLEQVSDRSMILMMAMVILMVVGFDLAIKYLCELGIPVAAAMVLRLVHGGICVFTVWMEYELLVNRSLLAERDVTRHVMAERERQYQQSRESIEAVNIKCHDLRHQIRSLAEGQSAIDPDALADVAREVDVYDAGINTGNEALDTILTEKSLLCQREGITLTCIADGSALGFMSPADIYALFGNALDNAIEAARGASRRSISLVVRSTMGVVSVSVENYFDPSVRPHFSEGLPLTTKQDRSNHGFGMRSMRAIAERYGGTLVARAEDETFRLNVMLQE